MSVDRWLNQFCKWEDAEQPTHFNGLGGQVPLSSERGCRLLQEQSTAVSHIYVWLEAGARRVELEACP